MLRLRDFAKCCHPASQESPFSLQKFFHGFYLPFIDKIPWFVFNLFKCVDTFVTFERLFETNIVYMSHVKTAMSSNQKQL